MDLIPNVAPDPNWPNTTPEPKQAQDIAKDQYLAMMFLLNCDPNWYGNLVWDIENEYTCGTDTYLTSLSVAYNYLMNYQPDTKASQHDHNKSGLS